MYVFLSILIVLASIALVFVVTIQNSKGGGLASGFASSNNVMGVRRTTDLIEKITWGLAIAVAVLAIVSVRWAPHTTNIKSGGSVISDYVDQATIPVAPEAAQPFGDTPVTTDTPAEAPAAPVASEETAE